MVFLGSGPFLIIEVPLCSLRASCLLSHVNPKPSCKLSPREMTKAEPRNQKLNEACPRALRYRPEYPPHNPQFAEDLIPKPGPLTPDLVTRYRNTKPEMRETNAETRS